MVVISVAPTLTLDKDDLITCVRGKVVKVGPHKDGYGKDKDENAVTYTLDQGFTHEQIDPGDEPSSLIAHIAMGLL